MLARDRDLARPARLTGFVARKEANSILLREEISRGVSTYRALPEVVTLNHTDICNLRCVMCPRNIAQGTHRLDQRVLSHVVNQLFPTAKKAVLTTSEGEPLGADFDFLLEQALRFEVRLDAVTNGVLLTQELYRRGRRAFDHLNVSLDSHEPEVYERIRLGSSHARVFGNLEAIAALRQEEPDDVLLSISAVVMRSNIEKLTEFVRFAASIGVDGVVFQRLLQDTKRTNSEALHPHYSVADVHARLDAAAAAAREVGVNLFVSEFGRENVMVRPLRAKVAPIVEGHGTCWFVAQDFNVMYTGEVYPCCIPTDHLLGNVLYEDPIEIWNGARFRKLREDHLTGRGNAFCSGCIHAPHLKAPKALQLNRAVRKTRMAVAHVRNKAVRRIRERTGAVIFDPGPPDVDALEFGFKRSLDRVTTEPIEAAPDAIHIDAESGIAHWLEAGTLWRSNDLRDGPHERLATLPRLAAHAGSAVFPVGTAVLFGFEGDGTVWRFAEGEVRPALRFEDDRSFLRRDAITADAHGRILVGEYGIFPGARCARIYASMDRGKSFQKVRHLEAARHIHLVQFIEGHGVVVTTGDLASERRMYVTTDGARFREVRSAWSGFTGIAKSNGSVHCGTDLATENGFVRFSGSLADTPEYRRLPDYCDAPIRKIIAIDDCTLVAWCRVDDDADYYDTDAWGSLLYSDDNGTTWTQLLTLTGAHDAVAESIELVSREPLCVVTVLTTEPVVMEIER